MPKLTIQWNSVPKLTFGAEVNRLLPKLLRAEVTRAEHRLPRSEGRRPPCRHGPLRRSFPSFLIRKRSFQVNFDLFKLILRVFPDRYESFHSKFGNHRGHIGVKMGQKGPTQKILIFSCWPLLSRFPVDWAFFEGISALRFPLEGIKSQQLCASAPSWAGPILHFFVWWMW